LKTSEVKMREEIRFDTVLIQYVTARMCGKLNRRVDRLKPVVSDDKLKNTVSLLVITVNNDRIDRQTNR